MSELTKKRIVPHIKETKKIIAWKEEEKWSAKVDRRISLGEMIELGVKQGFIRLDTSKRGFLRNSTKLKETLEYINAEIKKRIDPKYQQVISTNWIIDLKWEGFFDNLQELNEQFVSKNKLQMDTPKLAHFRFVDPDTKNEIQLDAKSHGTTTTITSINNLPVLSSFNQKQIIDLLKKSNTLKKLGFRLCRIKKPIEEGLWVCYTT